ncbi:hypothetical protein BH09SUM1_BH09SUM1_03390 [soil metagenome]
MTSPLRIALLVLVIAVFRIFSFAQESSDTLSSTGAPNVMCPVMTDQEADPSIFVDYEGQRVYLCCQKCKRLFSEHPEKYLSALPQFASIPMTTMAPAAASAPPAEAPLRGADRLYQFAGRFHPVMVHFPIALLIAAALADFLSLFRKDQIFRHGARYCLVLGAVAAVLAASLGWLNAAYGRWPGAEETLELHRKIGTICAIVAVIALALSEAAAAKGSRPLRITSRVFLYSAAVLVGLSGHFGAALIYGLDYFNF